MAGDAATLILGAGDIAPLQAAGIHNGKALLALIYVFQEKIRILVGALGDNLDFAKPDEVVTSTSPDPFVVGFVRLPFRFGRPEKFDGSARRIALLQYREQFGTLNDRRLERLGCSRGGSANKPIQQHKTLKLILR